MPQSDHAGVLQMLCEDQKYRQEQHSLDTEKMKPEIHGQQHGDGWEICLSGEQARFQQGTDKQGDGIEGEQGKTAGRIAKQKAENRPRDQDRSCAQYRQRVDQCNEKSGKDSMKIFISGNEERIFITSVFDNLGKGASGAAVQCMNISMGIDETTSLDI